jgi:predicted dehydrogenase
VANVPLKAEPAVKKAKIAVVGAGWWAVENHLPLLKANPDAEVVAVCTVGAENLAKVQHAFSIPYGTENYGEMLSNVALDGVVISSPHVCHFDQARAAMTMNRHVMVEKPFTTNAAEARELTRLEHEHAVSIVIPYGSNFSELADAATEYVRQGLLGEIQHGVLHMASATASLFRGERVAWASGSLVEPSPSTWADPQKAGGFGWGQLSHALGLLFLLVDSPAESVFSYTVKAASGVDLSDAASIRLRSGVTVAVSGSSALAPHAKAQLDLRLFGTAGHLSLDFERERVEVHTHAGKTLRIEPAKDAGVYTCKKPVGFFVDACMGRAGRNPASGIIGLRSIEVLDAMYRSAESGRPEAV